MPLHKNRLFVSGIALCITVSFASGLAGCNSANKKEGSMVSSAQSNEKVATIDGTVVTRGQYDKIYAQFSKMFRVNDNPETAKNPIIGETLKRMTLNKLVLNTLIQNETGKLGVSVTPAEVERFKQEQLKEAGSDAFLKRFLKENNISESEFDETLREQVLVNKFLEKKGGASLVINEADSKKYYESHPTEFQIPESVQARHILVKAIEPELKKELRTINPSLSDDMLKRKVLEKKAQLKTKAEELYTKVKQNPKEIPDLARRFSDDKVSALKGGELGDMNQNITDPTFWKALKSVKPGEIYPGVVETPFGFHIIQVEGEKQAHHQSFEEAKPAIMLTLLHEKKQKLLEGWLKEKQATAKIDIVPEYQPKQPQTAAGAGPEGKPLPSTSTPKQSPSSEGTNNPPQTVPYDDPQGLKEGMKPVPQKAEAR